VHAVFEGAPLLIAHRGGSALAPENTMAAFRDAVHRWRADMIELDVRASADGRCVVVHDATVDRTTNGTGAVSLKSSDELRELDAGWHFSPDGGRTFPFRGRGAGIPTIDEVLEEFPGLRLTVEIKSGDAQRPLRAAIERFAAHDRVIVAGMRARDRALFRDYAGPTSASREQLLVFLVAHRGRFARLAPMRADVVQAPEYHRGRRIITPRLIRDLHAKGVHVHVWTVNDPSDMERLLDWGVDGLVTDRPDLLGVVLQGRVGRAPAPGHSRD
jgi:glycerophosphoryl diester phosphodiesterase